MIDIEHSNPLAGDIDINQKRLRFDELKNNKSQVISNILIYCSQYYPVTK